MILSFDYPVNQDYVDICTPLQLLRSLFYVKTCCERLTDASLGRRAGGEFTSQCTTNGHTGSLRCKLAAAGRAPLGSDTEHKLYTTTKKEGA